MKTTTKTWDTVFSMGTYHMGVSCQDGAVSCIAFLPTTHPLKPPTSALARKAKAAIMAYARHPKGWSFDLPLHHQGTAFQNRVWRLLQTIPFGKTLTYKEIAHKLKSGPRAVGGACAANPFVLAVPCHRVVSVNGLGGFAGETQGRWPKLKAHLLQHEGVRGLHPPKQLRHA